MSRDHDWQAAITIFGVAYCNLLKTRFRSEYYWGATNAEPANEMSFDLHKNAHAAERGFSSRKQAIEDRAARDEEFREQFVDFAETEAELQPWEQSTDPKREEPCAEYLGIAERSGKRHRSGARHGGHHPQAMAKFSHIDRQARTRNCISFPVCRAQLRDAERCPRNRRN